MKRAVSRKEGNYGTAGYESMSPDALVTGSKMVNIFLPLDEVNRLRLSLDAGAHDVNSYRRLGRGKSMGLMLTIGLTPDHQRIQVYRAWPGSTTKKKKAEYTGRAR